MKWWRCLLAAMLVELLGASAAVAKDKDPQTAIARAHFEEGEKHYRLGHFDQALAAYEQAYLAKPLAGFLFNVGQCQRMLGRHKEAAYSYRRFLEAMPGAPNREEVQRLVASEEEAAAREERKSAPPPVKAAVIEAPRQPIVVDETPPPRSAMPEAPPNTAPAPEAKKWWIWAVIGGAAVVGAGAGFGLAYGLPNDAPLPIDDVRSPLTAESTADACNCRHEGNQNARHEVTLLKDP